LFNYLYCLDKSGGGTIEVSRSNSSDASSKLQVRIAGKGAGVVVSGGGEGVLSKDSSNKIINEIRTKLDPSLAAKCEKLATASEKRSNAPVERVSIPAERYTNLREVGGAIIGDYVLVNLYRDGSFTVTNAKTPGINVAIPEDILRRIEGKWVVEKIDIAHNPNREKFPLFEIGAFNGRVIYEVRL
jgi:hypothetical protein